MEITPLSKKRLFRPSFDVRFDDAQELRDVVGHGAILPDQPITGIRTLAVATSIKVEYPVVINYSDNQLRLMSEELAVAASQPEVVTDANQALRLEAISSSFRLAVETVETNR